MEAVALIYMEVTGVFFAENVKHNNKIAVICEVRPDFTSQETHFQYNESYFRNFHSLPINAFQQTYISIAVSYTEKLHGCPEAAGSQVRDSR